MNQGRTFPSESREFHDATTGALMRQVTAAPAIHHHPFFYVPAYDDAMQWLAFVSHRTGAPQIFFEERATGNLVQLTDRPNLNEWSVHPSFDGRHVYFTAGCGAWRASTETWREECLADFGDVPMIPHGMVGDAMGTTALSTDNRWWAVPVKVGRTARLHIIDTVSGQCEPILECEVIGHPQFHPRDSTLLHYAGPSYARMWTINRDGSSNRLAYRRDEAKKEWIVHEFWNPLDRELIAVNWPHGVIGGNIDTGAVRRICSFNAWHPMINRSGRLIVCDTNFPDIGLQLFSPSDGTGAPTPLCESKASNAGEHWRTDHCPYDDGPVKVYAPQHTHPHPNFSPDGTRVVFTSDRTGHAQVYEAVVPAELLPVTVQTTNHSALPGRN